MTTKDTLEEVVITPQGTRVVYQMVVIKCI